MIFSLSLKCRIIPIHITNLRVYIVPYSDDKLKSHFCHFTLKLPCEGDDKNFKVYTVLVLYNIHRKGGIKVYDRAREI